MVRAILEGRKTQTRRVIKPQSDVMYCDFDAMGWELIEEKREYSAYFKLPKPSWIAPDKPTWRRMKSIYGEPGDRLWVRETWLQDGEIYLYKADFGNGILSDSWNGHWKPSIHMPRKASRLMLEIVNVRAERLQDINLSDARAEGVADEDWDLWREDAETIGLPDGAHIQNEIDLFSELWDCINLSRGYGWDVNPWVWVIEFKRTA